MLGTEQPHVRVRYAPGSPRPSFRLPIALALGAGTKGDASTLLAIYSHDYSVVVAALRGWEEAGLLLRRRDGRHIRFTVNPGHRTYSALQNPIDGLLRHWSEYQRACRKAERLYAEREKRSKR